MLGDPSSGRFQFSHKDGSARVGSVVLLRGALVDHDFSELW